MMRSGSLVERPRSVGFALSGGAKLALLAASMAVTMRASVASAGDLPGAWGSAGPVNVGGRVSALAVDPNDANHIWLGSASGGVFASHDGGAIWTALFDSQPSLSIGAIAAHPTDSATVYVGTGEDNGGGYTYDGLGVFKTTDGGTTWTSLGLAETRRIGRIAIDPANPQRVFVAAGGGVFQRGVHRGVYRSLDGGASWEKVLFVADDAGAIDVAIDPASPNRIYAAIWQRSSTATIWTGGGPNSGIWQSTDGGSTWGRLANGLPPSSPPAGRIGLAIAPSSPQTVYALYRGDDGGFMGVWKTTNAGTSWFRADNPSGSHVSQFSHFGFYFGQIRVDPANAGNLYALDVNWYKSTDGGFKWQEKNTGIHVDHHDLVVLPGRLLMGNDGGFYSSANGSNWTHAEGLPISQLYAACFDRLEPLRRLAGLQDNGTVRTTTGSADWETVLGSDGFQCEFDPNDSSRVYAESQYGAIRRSNDGGHTFSGVSVGIDPLDRRNWNMPIAHDPVTSGRVYIGTMRIYRTDNGADSWAPVSPDLTNGPSLDAWRFAQDGAGVAGRSDSPWPGHASRVTPSTPAMAPSTPAMAPPSALVARTGGRTPGSGHRAGSSAPPKRAGPSDEGKSDRSQARTRTGASARPGARSHGRVRAAGGAAPRKSSRALSMPRMRERPDHATSTVSGTVTTIAVSPVDRDVVWAGTDDGNIWVTENAGAPWSQVDAPGFSQWVSGIEADPFDARTAYVSLTGRHQGSSAPHVLRTTDLGSSWADVSGNLPQEPVNCLAADPAWPGRVFAGTDGGVYLSEDGGASWAAMRTGMPRVVVADLDLIASSRTLFAATHGRSLLAFDLAQIPTPDVDGDGIVNSRDCAPSDPAAFAAPAEVVDLRFAPGTQTLTWASAAPGAGTGTVHDVLRGEIALLPVGSGETCMALGLSGSVAVDPSVPLPGEAFYYLVRGRNACGAGAYGFRSDGTPSTSTACD